MHRKFLAVVAGVLIAIGVGTAGGATAATAPQLITGVVRAEKTSANNSATAKSVTVKCPSNKSVIGTAGSIIGGSTKVLIDQIIPNDKLKKVTVSGKETDPYTSNWKVKAIAICADKPSGLQREWLPSPDDSTSPKPGAVDCDPGQTMLGTGFDIIGGKGEVGAYSVVPAVDAAGRAFGDTVNAAEVDSLTSKWHVNAFAICADSVYPQQVIFADGGATSNASAAETVYCPFGTVATGTGYEVASAVGQIIVTSVDPGGSTTSETDRSSISASEEDGTTLAWTPRSYVICANR
jgi:uncharacterized protein with FMN-binding domain